MFLSSWRFFQKTKIYTQLILVIQKCIEPPADFFWAPQLLLLKCAWAPASESLICLYFCTSTVLGHTLWQFGRTCLLIRHFHSGISNRFISLAISDSKNHLFIENDKSEISWSLTTWHSKYFERSLFCWNTVKNVWILSIISYKGDWFGKILFFLFKISCYKRG